MAALTAPSSPSTSRPTSPEYWYEYFPPVNSNPSEDTLFHINKEKSTSRRGFVSEPIILANPRGTQISSYTQHWRSSRGMSMDATKQFEINSARSSLSIPHISSHHDATGTTLITPPATPSQDVLPTQSRSLSPPSSRQNSKRTLSAYYVAPLVFQQTPDSPIPPKFTISEVHRNESEYREHIDDNFVNRNRAAEQHTQGASATFQFHTSPAHPAHNMSPVHPLDSNVSEYSSSSTDSSEFNLDVFGTMSTRTSRRSSTQNSESGRNQNQTMQGQRKKQGRGSSGRKKWGFFKKRTSKEPDEVSSPPTRRKKSSVPSLTMSLPPSHTRAHESPADGSLMPLSPVSRYFDSISEFGSFADQTDATGPKSAMRTAPRIQTNPPRHMATEYYAAKPERLDLTSPRSPYFIPPNAAYRSHRLGSVDSTGSGKSVLQMAGAFPPSIFGFDGTHVRPPNSPFVFPSPAIPSSPSVEPWSPPESWWVKPLQDLDASSDVEASDLETDRDTQAAVDVGTNKALHAGMLKDILYCVRVFRPDATFVTVSCPLDTRTADLNCMLGKKFFIHDVSRFQLTVRRNGLERVLGPSERPVQLMKWWFEQSGYRDQDLLEDLGREDNSYLFRFTFGEATVPNLPLPDLTSDRAQFTHMDYQGRDLQTIPIVLFRHADHIETLNISRNLLIDIPSDFVQLCTSLRELGLSGCDLEKVPSSLKHAVNLKHLDLSHNFIRDFDHARLDDLKSLESLLVDNNSLEVLPATWALFRNLQTFSASNNNLTSFPDVICDILTLRQLDLSFNVISSIPPGIGSLTELRRLQLVANQLHGALPAEISNLTKLVELDIRSNSLSGIDAAEGLPSLEVLFADRNNIAVFVAGVLPSLVQLSLSKNFLTSLAPSDVAPKLTYLNLADSKIAALPDTLSNQLPSLERLVLDRNYLTSLPDSFSAFAKLRILSAANNHLTEIPKVIAEVRCLETLDIHNNNVKTLPEEIWLCENLTDLNVSSNLLDGFPMPPPAPSVVNATGPVTVPMEGYPSVSKSELLLPPFVNGHSTRRNQEQSDLLSPKRALSLSNSPASVVSLLSLAPAKRRPLSESLQNLYLGDNNLTDDIFAPLSQMPELRVLNLAFNDIYEIPPGALFNQTKLVELYLSGNHIASLPTDEIERLQSLRVLYLNANKLQTLPAELGKITKLLVLDVGSNSLKYNIANWPYDWNWNWNLDLKYLNLSGNKRLEIKHSNGEAGASFANLTPVLERRGGRKHGAVSGYVHTGERRSSVGQIHEEKNFCDFSALVDLKVLGLMDVTLMVSVPEESDQRRIRTTASEINNVIAYGMADRLGRDDLVCSWDVVCSKLVGRDDEALIGLFDCRAGSPSGCRTTRYLNDWFAFHFTSELEKLKRYAKSSPGTDNVEDALRRSFLSLNKELGSIGMDDAKSGASALVVYLKGTTMYVSNVGDSQAVVSRSGGSAHVLSKQHIPWDSEEVDRVRVAGGWVSGQGLVNGELEVSRSFGHFHLLPVVNAEPHIETVQLSEQDEFVIMASRGLWNHISYQTAVDIARTERDDPMRAAQKLRDFAMTYGAKEGIMVMVINVGDLFGNRRSGRGRRNNMRGSSGRRLTGMSEGNDDIALCGKKSRRGKGGTLGDSTLARLDKEVEPPTGQIALVFTDIKSSTYLWEDCPIAMRSAIKIHNTVMRRSLRAIGGYEVKTEGDAFMVSFPTVTLALVWCFTVQVQLLQADWPREVLASKAGCDVYSSSVTAELLSRGLSVRMGMHWGAPVCEIDPVTRRMDYFGPMVNRAARICNVADGGQICVSADVVAEIMALKGLFSEEHPERDLLLSRDILALRRMGLTLVGIGEKKLKGLENAEVLSLLYPKCLSGRIELSNAAKTSTNLRGRGKGSIKRILQERPLGNQLDPNGLKILGLLTLRIERAAAGSVSLSTIAMLSPTAGSPRSSGTSLNAKDGPASIANVLTYHLQEGTDEEKLLRALESLVIRLEHCISSYEMKSTNEFRSLLEKMAVSLGKDPYEALRVLEMYVARTAELDQ